MTIGALDPISNPQAWDVLNLAGVDTPGRCEVGEFPRENTYDVKAGKGTQGATETLKTQPPAKGKVTFWAWQPAHFQAWDAITPLLRYDPNKDKNQQAIAVYHPSLADNGITAFLPPEKLGNWTKESTGLFKREIEFLEFVQPGASNVAVTATGAADQQQFTTGGQQNATGSGPEPGATAQGNNTSGAAKDAQGALGSVGP